MFEYRTSELAAALLHEELHEITDDCTLRSVTLFAAHFVTSRDENKSPVSLAAMTTTSLQFNIESNFV